MPFLLLAVSTRLAVLMQAWTSRSPVRPGNDQEARKRSVTVAVLGGGVGQAGGVH